MPWYKAVIFIVFLVTPLGFLCVAFWEGIDAIREYRDRRKKK